MSEVWIIEVRLDDAPDWIVLGVSATREGAKALAELNYEAPLERWADLRDWSTATGTGITFDIHLWTLDA